MANKRMQKKQQKKKDGEINKSKNQRILTLFILVFPVLLLAMVGIAGDLIMRTFLFVYEAILIKNFIDDYYVKQG